MFARKWLILGLALLAAIAGGVKVVSQAFASTASQITVQVTLSRAFVPADGHTSHAATRAHARAVRRLSLEKSSRFALNMTRITVQVSSRPRPRCLLY